MKFVFTQFHAEPLELVKISLQLAEEFGLFCICATTKSKEIIDAKSISLDKHENSEFLLVLFEQDYSNRVKSFSDLLSFQNEGVYIEVGSLSEGGLKESIISFSKEEIKYEKIDPKKVIAKFKKFTKAGAVAFNAKTGAEGVSKNHRYTEGAKALYESGVKIIPFGGGKTVFFKLP